MINRLLILLFTGLSILGCGSEENEFPIDKPYWDLNDYDNIIRKLKYGYKDDEKIPSFDDPDTRIVVEKLTDQKNFRVILEDRELGLKHKSEVSRRFFDDWKNMSDIYNLRDRQDKYVYDEEMLAVWHFGLGLQALYFKLNNDEILESADDPNSTKITNLVESNVSTMISNYLAYLDEINDEDAFTKEGKSKLAEGIDRYFISLVEKNPNANFSNLKKKSELLIKKSESENIKSSLKNLIDLIDSKNSDIKKS